MYNPTAHRRAERLALRSESRNREVASLGVTFVLVPEGVDRRIFEKGLSDWRAAKDGRSSPTFVERRGKRKGTKLKATEEG
jgi:magnesium-dependent phosphatase 1